MKKLSVLDEKGFSLLELLIALIISTIAFFALAVPFFSERSLWGIGKRQTEAQRDAQMVIRAIAHIARESLSYEPPGGGTGDRTLTLTRPDGTKVCFRGGPDFNNGQLQQMDATCTNAAVTLIDGARSRVVEFEPTTVVAGKLVKVRLNMAHRNSATWTNEPVRNEIIETQIFLRNG